MKQLRVLKRAWLLLLPNNARGWTLGLTIPQALLATANVIE
jgi:hypothetical protein